MFIIWGSKTVYRKLGYVAHFCEICRAPKPFELKRVGSVGHLYYISFGQGELLGYERTCQDCGTTLQADVEEFAAVAPQVLPISDLIRQTYPRLEQVVGARLALEAQLRRNPAALSADERHVLIRNPFVLMSARVDARFARIHIDRGIGLALAGAVALVLFAPMLVLKVAPGTDIGAWLLSFLVIGFGAIIWQIMASRPRYVRREVLPLLDKSLRPLHPTQPELEAVVRELAGLKSRLARRIDVAELYARVSRAAA